MADVSGLCAMHGVIEMEFHGGHGGAPLNWFAPGARSRTAPLGMAADIALQGGVTTLVYGGTAGASSFLQEKDEVIDRDNGRVLTVFSICG